MKGTIPTYIDSIPVLTTQQMIEVDKLMIEEYKIELIQMMENAGRCLAVLAMRRFLEHSAPEKDIIILAGTGGNGGGAMVCARRLATWGFNVQVYVTSHERMAKVPGHQLDILTRMGVQTGSVDQLPDNRVGSLIIDGIIGYSIKGDPRNAAKEMIEWANRQKAFVMSLDTPSGIDLTTGNVYSPVIRADATLTLALPKSGLYGDQVKPIRGELYLGDISVPPGLYRKPGIGLEVSKALFRQGDVLRID